MLVSHSKANFQSSGGDQATGHRSQVRAVLAATPKQYEAGGDNIHESMPTDQLCVLLR